MPPTHLIASVAVALAAAALATAGVGATSGSPACGSGSTALSTQDVRSVAEYRRLLSQRAATVWPGWSRVPPLLQRKGACEYVIGVPSSPKGFHRLTARAAGWPVDAAPAGTLTPGPVASTWKVGAAWVTVVPTRDELQRTLDRVLGAGAVRLNDTSYVRSLVHEAFHAHQMTVTNAAPPAFGSSFDEQQATAVLARLGDAEARLAGEGAALAAALTATSVPGARRGVALFERLRAERRNAASDPGGLAAFERQIEWAEGTARYADLRLVLLAGGGAYRPTPGVRYTPAAAYRSAFLSGLANAAPRRDGIRGRWEDLGAAEALLLDRLAPGWRRDALPGRQSLESLLSRAVAAG